MTKGIGVAVALLLGAAGILAAGIQVQQGKTRPAQTRHLMKGIVKPNSAALDGVWKAGGPSNDEAWDLAAVQAASISEIAYSLMDDGRCPDKIWADACRKMQEGSAALILAAEKKDPSAGKAALATVKESCALCHKEHKKKKQ